MEFYIQAIFLDMSLYVRILDLNKRSLYDFNRHKLNYIIENDGSKEELKSKVKDIYLDILKK